MCGDASKRRDPELGLPETIAATLRGRGGGSAGTQTGTAAAGVGPAFGQDAGQPAGRPTAGQGAAATADLAGGRFPGSSRAPAGVRTAGAAQDAFSMRPGPGVDFAPCPSRVFHTDLQAGAAALGGQKGPAPGCAA